jgi:hypothetical protein
MAVDTLNKYMVGGSHGGKFVSIQFIPHGVVSPDDALNLAAWLVVVAEPHATEKFDKVLKAVRSA